MVWFEDTGDNYAGSIYRWRWWRFTYPGTMDVSLWRQGDGCMRMVPVISRRDSERKYIWCCWRWCDGFLLQCSFFSMHSSHSRTLAYLAKIQIGLCSIVEHIVDGTFGTQRHDVVCFTDPVPHSTSSVVYLRLIFSGIFSAPCYFITNLSCLGLVEWHQMARPHPSRLTVVRKYPASWVMTEWPTTYVAQVEQLPSAGTPCVVDKSSGLSLVCFQSRDAMKPC